MKPPHIVKRTQTIMALQTAVALKHQYLFYFLTGSRIKILHPLKLKTTWVLKKGYYIPDKNIRELSWLST